MLRDSAQCCNREHLGFQSQINGRRADCSVLFQFHPRHLFSKLFILIGSQQIIFQANGHLWCHKGSTRVLSMEEHILVLHHVHQHFLAHRLYWIDPKISLRSVLRYATPIPILWFSMENNLWAHISHRPLASGTFLPTCRRHQQRSDILRDPTWLERVGWCPSRKAKLPIICIVGIGMSIVPQILLAEQIGRAKACFMIAIVLQVILSVRSLCQLITRGSTRGFSSTLWFVLWPGREEAWLILTGFFGSRAPLLCSLSFIFECSIGPNSLVSLRLRSCYGVVLCSLLQSSFTVCVFGKLKEPNGQVGWPRCRKASKEFLGHAMYFGFGFS